MRSISKIFFLIIAVICFATSALSQYDPEDPKNVQLLDAVKQGDETRVKQLLAEGANPNILNVEKVSVLKIAARNGSTQIVKLLLESGANPSSSDEEWSALRGAAYNGYVEIVRLLIEAGAEINVTPKASMPILVYVIGKNEPASFEVIQELVKHGADLNASSHQGITPMLMAAMRNRKDIMSLLEKAGADKEAAEKWRLAEAASTGNSEAVVALIQKGISINSEDVWGRTPLIAAIGKNQLELFDQLIALGADPNHASKKDGSTPLIASTGEGKELIFRKLLAARVDLNYQDKDGSTALMYAAKSGAWWTVQELLKAGASTELRDRHGDPIIVSMLRYQQGLSVDQINALKLLIDFGADVHWETPYTSTLDLAVATENKEAVKLLRAKGAKLGANYENSMNDSFHYKNIVRLQLYIEAGFDFTSDARWLNRAAESNDPDIVRLFLKAGADPTMKGSYALGVAVQKGNTEIVKELINAGATPHVHDLEIAISNGSNDIVKLFEEAGVESPQVKKIEMKRELYSKLQARDTKATLDLFHEFEKVAGPNESATELLSIAENFYSGKDIGVAMELYQELVAHYPGKPERIFAWFRLGEIEWNLGNEKAALEFYVKAAQGSYIHNEFQDPFRFSYGQEEAIKKLATYHASKNDCDQAIYWWKLYQPSGGGCGTGMMAAENWKSHQIAMCEIQRGKVDEGLLLMENTAFNSWETNQESIMYLIDYYEKNGKLDEIEKRFSERYPASSEYPSAGQMYIDLIRASKNKDILTLWRFLKEPSPGDTFARKAMESIVQLGKPAEEFALEKLNNDPAERGPALFVLGRMKAKIAVKRIIEMVRVEKNINVIRPYFRALALMDDPEAMEVINKYAAEGSGNHKFAAQQTLESLKAGTLDN